MANWSTLSICEVALDDIPQITEVWYRAFSTPHNLELFPDTPAVRSWWNKNISYDLVNRPYQKYIKVVDAACPGEIIAYAKWDLQPDECGERFLPWHPESNAELCAQLFGGIELQRKSLMRGCRHFYLDMLATNPEHGRRGAASLLVHWGCDIADRNGITIYVSSSDQAVGLYQKFGFKLVEGLDDIPEGSTPMIREPCLTD
ncbi:acyl-CoA N-acyltransferase [Aspergillus bertholletiae]|uniref:Acyl-CoA N-acyltransferase n=1 Tax=Aspergillus bertholletiae TaxID=1226010 RepID=A0A5N7BIW8_9EURO|nr:acyl-CoA N-acyltransferase [Aspergillus bertholletiae]